MTRGAGVSSVAKGYSSYVDSMTDMKMSKAFRDFAPMDVISTVSTEFRYIYRPCNTRRFHFWHHTSISSPLESPHFYQVNTYTERMKDYTNIFSVILCFGMKESTKLNTAFTLLNISIILFVMIGGAWHGDNLALNFNIILEAKCR